MNEIYKRINSIRNKIEEKQFSSIYDYFENNWLKISKENYELVLKKLWKEPNKSYCKYVCFIKNHLE